MLSEIHASWLGRERLPNFYQEPEYPQIFECCMCGSELEEDTWDDVEINDNHYCRDCFEKKFRKEA